MLSYESSNGKLPSINTYTEKFMEEIPLKQQTVERPKLINLFDRHKNEFEKFVYLNIQ